MQTQVVHSWPAWTLGPRAAHAKFGGSTIIGGIASVDQRLRIIKSTFPDDLTSGHLWHEFGTNLGAYAPFNSKDAVTWFDLVKGIEAGYYPHVAALTVPAFGIPGVQNGALLSPDPTIARMYYDMHFDGIVKSKRLKAQGWGLGVYISWPAWDSRRMYHDKNPHSARRMGPACQRMGHDLQRGHRDASEGKHRHRP
jgi:hypothetical protein